MDCQRNSRSPGRRLLVSAALLILVSHARATPHHDHSSVRRNATASTTPRPASGYFVPPQVVKINQHDAVLATPASQASGNRDSSDKSDSQATDVKSPVEEELPKPEAQRMSAGEYKAAYGLPGYNGPEDFSPRRGTTAADYSAAGAGFVPSESFQNKQLKYLAPAAASTPYDSLERYGTFKPAASEFIPTTYQSSEDQFGARRYNQQRYPQQDNRRPFAPQSGITNPTDYNGFMRTSSSEQSASVSGGSQQQQPQQSSQHDAYSQSSRRKPFNDQDVQSSSNSHQQGPYDQPSFPQSKHYLSTEVVRDSSPGDLFADGQASQSMEQTVSATNDNELAQLAATMSEFSSSPTSTPDFGMSGSDSLGLTDASGFGSLGSSSMLGSHAFAGSMPPPNSVPGELSPSLLAFPCLPCCLLSPHIICINRRHSFALSACTPCLLVLVWVLLLLIYSLFA